jgi:hypothetical protein
MDTTTMVSVVPGLFGFSTPLFPRVRAEDEVNVVNRERRCLGKEQNY